MSGLNHSGRFSSRGPGNIKELSSLSRRLPPVPLRDVQEDTANSPPKLIDQLKRALSSAILNLAEGNGRQSLKERRRFFDIALASIAETSSALDILSAYRLISNPEEKSIRENLRIAYAMIVNLKKSVF